MYPYDFFTQYRVSKLTNQVFVGMWFGNEHKPRFDDIISKACLDMVPYRVDLPVSGGSIPINILEGILNSKILLFEISFITPEITLPNGEKIRYRNANVMYELGLAHAWRLPEEIIVIRDDNEKLPFDITAYRVHTYNPNDAAGSITKISEIITKALAEINRAKSIMIERAAKSLDGQCLQFMNGNKGHYFSETRMDDLRLRNVINRLLDLGMVWFHTSGDGTSYAYHWTDLGWDVFKNLGIQTVSKDLS